VIAPGPDAVSLPDGRLQQLLERVLALPEIDAPDAALLQAFLGGDRCDALVERMRARHRTGARRNEDRGPVPAAILAVGWAILAALNEIAGDMSRRDGAMRWALEALGQVEADRPTVPCDPPDEAPRHSGDLDWDADPAGQPGGRC